MAYGQTSNFPYGVSNVIETNLLGDFVALDPSKTHMYFNDFDTFTAAEWTVTETQAAATQAVAVGDGGWLALVNSAASADVNAVALATKTFLLSTSKRFWMKTRFKVDNGSLSDVMFGLVDVATAFNPASGVYLLRLAAGTTTLSLEKASAVTSSTASTVTIANDTFVEMGISFNGVAVKGWMNNAGVGNVTTLTNMPIVDLTPMIGVRNGSAAARTMNVDYIMVAQER